MVDAFLCVIKGSLTIVTLGWLTYNMDFWYMFKCSKKDLNKKINAEKT